MVKNEHISPIFTNTLTSTELIIKFKKFGLIIMHKGLNQFHFLLKIPHWYGLLMCDLFYQLPCSEYSSYSWIEISVCFKCHLKVYLFATKRQSTTRPTSQNINWYLYSLIQSDPTKFRRIVGAGLSQTGWYLWLWGFYVVLPGTNSYMITIAFFIIFFLICNISNYGQTMGISIHLKEKVIFIIINT